MIGDRVNDFYRKYYTTLVIIVLITVVLLGGMSVALFYQIKHRPLPLFIAINSQKQELQLNPYDEPNLMDSTLINWAKEAAVVAYTYDFVNYDKQMALARPYFTDAGWAAYQGQILKLIDTLKANQLFVYGVVSGPPVVSNQGPLPGRGYVWRIQMPFLVVYRAADNYSRQSYFLAITIVHVPTTVNPQGIGIDQFVMV